MVSFFVEKLRGTFPKVPHLSLKIMEGKARHFVRTRMQSSITSLLDIFINSFYFVPEVKTMLCKRTYKNQITLPKKIMEQFEGYEYFDVKVSKGKIILEPVKMTPKDKILLEKVRDKIAALGLTPEDIEDAVVWARKE